MYLSSRDRAVLSLLGEFSVLSFSHVRRLAFPANVSDTPAKRCITRLLSARLITRLDLKLVGEHGGGGNYLYKLSPNGSRLSNPGARHREKVNNFIHTLAVADLAVSLFEMERLGFLNTITRLTEPDCWRTVGNIELRPDMYLSFEIRGGRKQVMFEVDLATERGPHLTRKLEAYVQGLHEAGRVGVKHYPRIIWIVPSEARKAFLGRLVERLPESELFKVVTLSELSTALL